MSRAIRRRLFMWSERKPGMKAARCRVLTLVVVGALAAAVPALSKEFPPQVARGIVLPAGFAATVFAQVPGLPTSLAWGPSTAPAAGGAAALDHGTLLYVTAIVGNFAGGTDNGSVVAFADEGVAPTTVASGLDQPLGVVMGPDKTLYVSETENNRGRVTALLDTNADGVFETKQTVLKNLPNGRHQTNGLTFGPDGMLYVANGNATDDGVECGPALTPGGSEDDCPAAELKPWTGSIVRVNPAWRDVDLLADVRVDADGMPAADGMDDESVLVAQGFRNIYDVDFDPLRANEIWTPMNGPDNPSGSEPLYGLDTRDQQYAGAAPDGSPLWGPRIEDAGFPSCLYDAHVNLFPVPQVDGGHEHPGSLEPQDNPNQRVIDRFGPCQKGSILLPKTTFREGHEGTTGIAFTRGANFPERYRGDLFVGEWGSLWNLNGGAVTGHKLIHLDLDADRNVVGQNEFMSGILPMDVTFGPNGHMYVADMSGQIYDVSHVTDAATPDVVTVDMRQGQFLAPVVTVVRGQTVRWVNADTTAHNVRAVQKVKLVDPRGAESPAQSGSEMNSPGDIPPGGSYSHTFSGETAVYHYNSTTTGLEANTMRGTIVVLPVER